MTTTAVSGAIKCGACKETLLDDDDQPRTNAVHHCKACRVALHSALACPRVWQSIADGNDSFCNRACLEAYNNKLLAFVLVEVLCAHNDTQHQQKHKITPHSSKQSIFGLITRARTRNDAWDHALPIAHARLASHWPHLPSKAQYCTMSGITPCSSPHTAGIIATRHRTREREQREQQHRMWHHATSGVLRSKARRQLPLPHAPAGKLTLRVQGPQCQTGPETYSIPRLLTEKQYRMSISDFSYPISESDSAKNIFLGYPAHILG
jgi:hypothetical protein